METVHQLVNNEILMIPLIGWCVAQFLKAVIHCIVNHKFTLERMVGSGGMPSCHSSMVTSLAIITCLVCGPGSAAFGVAVIFAMVTMYDAMGVRRETGRQGEVLNDMIELFKKMGQKLDYDKALKELIGHTPFQVLMGMACGTIVTLVCHYCIWN